MKIEHKLKNDEVKFVDYRTSVCTVDPSALRISC
jgi:hypothetical protein